MPLLSTKRFWEEALHTLRGLPTAKITKVKYRRKQPWEKAATTPLKLTFELGFQCHKWLPQLCSIAS